MARIVAIADVFDALSMTRPYKEAWPLDRIMDTLKDSAGTHFDPQLIECFTGILSQILAIKDEWDACYPKGTRSACVHRASSWSKTTTSSPVS